MLTELSRFQKTASHSHLARREGKSWDQWNRRRFLYYLSLLGLERCTPTNVAPRSTDPSQVKLEVIRDWSPLPSKVITGNLAVPSIVGTSHAPNPPSVNVENNVENMVKAPIEKEGIFSRIVRPGQQVLIKPNLFSDVPSGTGFTTDIRVAEAVAKMALDCGAKRSYLEKGLQRIGTL